jgi:hypothetical protein
MRFPNVGLAPGVGGFTPGQLETGRVTCATSTDLCVCCSSAKAKRARVRTFIFGARVRSIIGVFLHFPNIDGNDIPNLKFGIKLINTQSQSYQFNVVLRNWYFEYYVND